MRERRAGPDAIVVGGGLAGAAAACRLARAGRHVVLFEREPGPHHKVCGEFLSPEAAADLLDLGIDLAGCVPDAGCESASVCMPVETVRLTDGVRLAAAALPFRAYGLSRRRLDEMLLTRAAALGAEIRRGVAVRAIEAGPGVMPVVRLAAGVRRAAGVRHAAGVRLSARAVFLATGKHDLRGWTRPAPAEAPVGLKLHLGLAPEAAAALARHVELHFFDGGYLGLQRIETGDANLCLVLRPDLLRRLGGRWDDVRMYLAGTSPILAERLRGTVPRWDRPLAVARIPYGYRHRGGPATGVWRLGDQAAVTPSFTGDGMAIALESARLAAAHFLAGGTDADYHRALGRSVGAQLRVARMLSGVLGFGPSRGLAFGLLGLCPGLVRAGARLTRLSGAARENRALP